MNEIKVLDEEAKKGADAVYHFAKANYNAGARHAIIGVGTVVTVFTAGAITAIVINAIKKKRSEKNAD